MQGRAPRQDCPRGRPDRPGRAGAPDPCSDTPPLRAWHLHLPLITQESTGAPPGRSDSTSDCVSGEIFYLKPVYCAAAAAAVCSSRCVLWPWYNVVRIAAASQRARNS
eukprot:COSAG01_NODE_15074_length_1377_cov_10.768388_2_plen_108_part_00